MLPSGSLSCEALPFPAPPPAGTFARQGRGTSGTGVAPASLQKSPFDSTVFSFPALKTKRRQGEMSPRSQNQQTAHTGHSLCKALSSAGPGQPWNLPLPPSATQLVIPLSLLYSHHFFPMGVDARECSQLLQHAPSSPLSSRTKMGGRGTRTGGVCVPCSRTFVLSSLLEYWGCRWDGRRGLS